MDHVGFLGMMGDEDEEKKARERARAEALKGQAELDAAFAELAATAAREEAAAKEEKETKRRRMGKHAPIPASTAQASSSAQASPSARGSSSLLSNVWPEPPPQGDLAAWQQEEGRRIYEHTCQKLDSKKPGDAEVAKLLTLKWKIEGQFKDCLLYTSPSPRDRQKSRMPSSA